MHFGGRLLVNAAVTLMVAGLLSSAWCDLHCTLQSCSASSLGSSTMACASAGNGQSVPMQHCHSHHQTAPKQAPASHGGHDNKPLCQRDSCQATALVPSGINANHSEGPVVDQPAAPVPPVATVWRSDLPGVAEVWKPFRSPPSCTVVSNLRI